MGAATALLQLEELLENLCREHKLVSTKLDEKTTVSGKGYEIVRQVEHGLEHLDYSDDRVSFMVFNGEHRVINYSVRKEYLATQTELLAKSSSNIGKNLKDELKKITLSENCVAATAGTGYADFNEVYIFINAHIKSH